MSTPQKAAKKTPAKSAPKPEDGKDLRRAHEHQGRIEALRPSLGKHTADVDALAELAQQEIAGSHFKDAADLFRAAEHLSFGLLVSAKSSDQADPKLTESFKVEFEHKLEKAQEHWKETSALAGIYQKTVDEAHKAFDDGAHRKALELVRAAEALAHVHLHHGHGSSETQHAA